jgi:predicted SnoaL-like aldol condensation-catalyzing enzyme
MRETAGETEQNRSEEIMQENMQEKNKEVVRALYKEFFNDHVVESADKYVREDYKQHNPGVGQGREALKSAFAEKFIEHPEFRLDIKMMVADGDMVWVYLKNVDPEGNTRCRVVDMYRLADGKLAEHWDVLQPC